MWYLIRGITVRLHNILYNEIYDQKALKSEIGVLAIRRIFSLVDMIAKPKF